MPISTTHKLPILRPSHNSVNEALEYVLPNELHVFNAFELKQCSGEYTLVKATYAPYTPTLPQGIIVNDGAGICYEKTASSATADVLPTTDVFNAAGVGTVWTVVTLGAKTLLPLGLA